MTERDDVRARLEKRLRDPEELRRWLKGQPREAIVAFAARAALRAAPGIASLIVEGRISAKRRRDIVLPVLRVMAAPWVAAKYPTHGGDVNFAAANAAAFAAANAADATDAAFAAFAAANAAAFAAADAADAANAAAFAAADAANAADAADAAALAMGVTPAVLLSRPLWGGPAPEWVMQSWRALRAALPKDEHWDVWTRWYDAVLAGGDRFVEPVEVFRATRPEEFWTQPVAAINAAIKDEEARWASLEPRPAAHDFRVVDGRIDVMPEDARPIDAETAQDLRDEALRKARALQARLETMQADEMLREDVAALIARLEAQQLRPGLLLSSIASLESALRSYGAEELSPDALKSMHDVAETMRSLNATFPKAREIEAERVAQSLPMDRLDEIERPAAQIVGVALQSDAVSEGAAAALQNGALGVVTARSTSEKAKQLGYLLLDLANFGRAGARQVAEGGLKIATSIGKGVSTVGREGAGFAGDCWKEVRKQGPKKFGQGVGDSLKRVGQMATIGGFSALMGALAGPYAALGAFFSGMWGINKTLQDASGEAMESQEKASPTEAGSAEAGLADAAPAHREATPRKASEKTRARK